MNEAILEWLARAQQRFPRVRILAVCVLSNHLHLVVRDEEAELADWASYFFGHLARAVNRIRGRSGTCFERRYSAEPILDDEALLDRLVYVVTNPVQAGLCKRVNKWPGVVLFAASREAAVISVSWVDRDLQRPARIRARLLGNRTPNSDTFRIDGCLTVDPIEGIDNEALNAAIGDRERKIADERRCARRRTLTVKQVLTQSWRSAPRRPKRSQRPSCHTADPEVRRRFREGFSEFVSLFREASERIRSGAPDAMFPEWCYPPGRPLLRPARVGRG